MQCQGIYKTDKILKSYCPCVIFSIPTRTQFENINVSFIAWKERGKIEVRVVSSLLQNGRFWCVPTPDVDLGQLKIISEKLRWALTIFVENFLQHMRWFYSGCDISMVEDCIVVTVMQSFSFNFVSISFHFIWIQQFRKSSIIFQNLCRFNSRTINIKDDRNETWFGTFLENENHIQWKCNCNVFCILWISFCILHF